MALIEPPKGRARIIDLGSELRIEIPMKPHRLADWLSLLFFGVFCAAWLVAGIAVLVTSLNPPRKTEPPPPLFTLSFALMWAVAAIFVTSWFLQMLMGREEILVTPQELSIRRRPIGKQVRYRLSEVKNLRVLEDFVTLAGNWIRWHWMWLPYQGVLAFDYGASTVRFGAMIEPVEARQIVALIEERFGKYMKAG